MTVGRLKELLNKCDDDMEVVVIDGDGEIDIDINPIFVSTDDRLVIYCNDDDLFFEEDEGDEEDEEDIKFNFYIKHFLT